MEIKQALNWRHLATFLAPVSTRRKGQDNQWFGGRRQKATIGDI
jgi:hypothetical protein